RRRRLLPFASTGSGAAVGNGSGGSGLSRTLVFDCRTGGRSARVEAVPARRRAGPELSFPACRHSRLNGQARVRGSRRVAGDLRGGAPPTRWRLTTSAPAP